MTTPTHSHTQWADEGSHVNSTKVGDIGQAKLRRCLREIAADHICWGRRMAHHVLKDEGCLLKHKRHQPFWHEEGVERPIPRKQ